MSLYKEPPAPDAVAAALATALRDATAQPGGLQEYAPLARLGTQICSYALGQFKGPSLLDAVTQMLPDVLGNVASEIGAVANLVPIYGALANAVVKVFEAFTTEPDHTERSIQMCLADAVLPQSTGSGGQYVPADLFVRNYPGEGFIRPDVGALLVAVTEDVDKLNFKLRHRDPKLGIAHPSFPKWRRILDGCHRQLDGGAAIYPLWLDLFRQAWDAGAVTSTSVRAWQIYGDLRYINATNLDENRHKRGWARDWAITASYGLGGEGMGSLPPNDAEARPCCARFDNRSRVSVGEILRVWRDTAFPSYAEDKKHMADIESQALLRAQQVVRPGGVHVAMGGLAAAHASARAPGDASPHSPRDDFYDEPEIDAPTPTVTPAGEPEGAGVVLWMGPVSDANLRGAVPDGWKLITINKGAGGGTKASDFRSLPIEQDAITQYAGGAARVILAAWSAGGALLDQILHVQPHDPRIAGVVCADAFYLASNTLSTLGLHDGVRVRLSPHLRSDVAVEAPFRASASKVAGPDYDDSAKSWQRALRAWFPVTGDIVTRDADATTPAAVRGRETTLEHAPGFSLLELPALGHVQHATIAAPILLRWVATDLGAPYADGLSVDDYAQSVVGRGPSPTHAPAKPRGGAAPSTPNAPAPAKPPASTGGGGLGLVAAVGVGLLLLDGKKARL